MADPNEATTHADLYHRHGDVDSSKFDEAEAVTGRPADVPGENSTFASRAKESAKQVKADDAEDKAVKAADTKAAPAKKAASARKGK